MANVEAEAVDYELEDDDRMDEEGAIEAEPAPPPKFKSPSPEAPPPSLRRPMAAGSVGNPTPSIRVASRAGILTPLGRDFV